MPPDLLLALLVLGLAAAAVFGALWLRGRKRAARLEVENERLRHQLERAANARENFFDLVTHELLSPLSAVLGYQELLEEGSYGRLPEPAAESITRVGRSARHLLHLINGVIELSRMRSGAVHPEPGTVDLAALFESVANDFRTAARERRIDPTVHLDRSLPTIRSDQDRLVRAMDLLVTSAVKYPADSELTFDVTADGEGVTVRVAGVGITVPDDASDLAQRVGIRLAVAEATARVLGGSLEFEADDHAVIRALSFHIPALAPG